MGKSVLQDWVMTLTFMQQSVLIAAVRGPDGIRKNHPVKVLMRWYRRCILLSAFSGTVFENAYEKGGGSFTGPVDNGVCKNLADAFKQYLESVDELPHHFQLHFMHAVEILGYKHPNSVHRAYWNNIYNRIVNDAHLRPETEQAMDRRLGDNENHWCEAEEVVAQ
jgi:hypothetical protein